MDFNEAVDFGVTADSGRGWTLTGRWIFWSRGLGGEASWDWIP